MYVRTRGIFLETHALAHEHVHTRTMRTNSFTRCHSAGTQVVNALQLVAFVLPDKKKIVTQIPFIRLPFISGSAHRLLPIDYQPQYVFGGRVGSWIVRARARVRRTQFTPRPFYLVDFLESGQL